MNKKEQEIMNIVNTRKINQLMVCVTINFIMLGVIMLNILFP